MHWYLVHNKPRQDKCALENLQRQGYQCYLPTLVREKICRSVLTLTEEALFPRYLFIRLTQREAGPGWAPIRSTKGVRRLVSFGQEPVKVPDDLVESLCAQEVSFRAVPESLFRPGGPVLLTQAPFSGVEGVYQMSDGESRVMVLIELLSRLVQLRVPSSGLRKLG